MTNIDQSRERAIQETMRMCGLVYDRAAQAVDSFAGNVERVLILGEPPILSSHTVAVPKGIMATLRGK